MQAQTRQRIKIGVVIVSAVVLLIVFLQNTGQVTVKILLSQVQMPMVAWLILTLLAGFALGYLTRSILSRGRTKALP